MFDVITAMGISMTEKSLGGLILQWRHNCHIYINVLNFELQQTLIQYQNLRPITIHDILVCDSITRSDVSTSGERTQLAEDQAYGENSMTENKGDPHVRYAGYEAAAADETAHIHPEPGLLAQQLEAAQSELDVPKPRGIPETKVPCVQRT